MATIHNTSIASNINRMFKLVAVGNAASMDMAEQAKALLAGSLVEQSKSDSVIPEFRDYIQSLNVSKSPDNLVIGEGHLNQLARALADIWEFAKDEQDAWKKAGEAGNCPEFKAKESLRSCLTKMAIFNIEGQLVTFQKNKWKAKKAAQGGNKKGADSRSSTVQGKSKGVTASEKIAAQKKEVTDSPVKIGVPEPNNHLTSEYLLDLYQAMPGPEQTRFVRALELKGHCKAS